MKNRRMLRRAGFVLCGVVTTVVLLVAALVVMQGPADASSHREAPLISKDAFADNTDTYVFLSPENPNNIVLIGSWIPFEGPEGGPYYFEWDDNALYDIYVSNDGDAAAEFTYTLSSKVEVQNPNTFLYNTGPIDSLNDTDWNRVQVITVTEQAEGQAPEVLVGNVRTTPANIGSKSTPNYAALEQQAIALQTVQNNGDTIKIYGGATDDAFWVDLQVFDLVTLRGQDPPVGYSTGKHVPVDSVSGFNVHSLVIEVPVSRLKQGTETVLGMWAGTRRPSTRVLLGPGGLGNQTNSPTYTQVSRLAMPLVNEVVIPLALKDAFNSIPPSFDLPIYTGALGAGVAELLQRSVEDPELGRLLCTLYGVPLPDDADANCSTDLIVGTPRSGRGDIFDIFLTGMTLANPFTITTGGVGGLPTPTMLPAGFNVNRPAGAVPAEMIRINTAISGATCHPRPQRLGVLAGDACGFPNGRRLSDDIVEIELAAVAGAAYQALDGRDAAFTFSGGLLDVLDDNVDGNDVAFRTTFPYMGLAQSGQDHIHLNPISLMWMSPVNVALSLLEAPGKLQVHPMSAAGMAALLIAPALLYVWRRK
jgi:hypothetical protein